MMVFILFFIAFIWLAGAWLRIYHHARFYQIEEYMTGRYLRWLFRDRERWLPTRVIAAWVGGVLLTFVMSEAPDALMAVIFGIGSALLAALPPDAGEQKKRFRVTPRARRMLAVAFALPTLLLLPLVWLVAHALTSSELFQLVSVGFMGLLTLLAAPLWLLLGNLLMTPVEAALRKRFIQQARRTLEDVRPVVIGITGSYGKTSTKTYLAHILNGRYRAYATPKSYNTLMGICIAINNDLAHDHSVDYFIAEMGAYYRGEIERLAELTKPSIGIEIEVGPQHLERFGSLENTMHAKYELVKALPQDGLAVFNWDNSYTRAMYEQGYPAQRIAVSREVDPAQAPPGGPRFIASDIEETLNGLCFTVTDVASGQSEPFVTPLVGIHNVTNILLATAVAVHERMSLKDVARRARTLQPAESRLVRNTTPAGITIINDAYSANPAGVASALRVLGLHQTGRRLLITPGMVELGPLMEPENRRLGELAAQHATDVILVGEKQTAPIREGLLGAGFPSDRLMVVDTLAESVQWYQNNLRSGDSVLFLNDLPDTYSS